MPGMEKELFRDEKRRRGFVEIVDLVAT